MPNLGNHPHRPDRRTLISGGLALTVGGLALGGLSACSDLQAPIDDQGRVRIRFATNARASAEQGGFYQALASGNYERRGLNVEIVQGGPTVDVPRLMSSGAVELGLCSSSFVPLRLAADSAPVKAVAAFFQKDTAALFAHPDPALDTLDALTGRPMLLSQAWVDTVWHWLKAEYGYSDDQLRPFLFDPAAFLDDPTAVQQGQITVDPYVIRDSGGFDPRSFLLADAGYASYGAIVLSPDAFARDNARALRAFIAASAEGWRDYVNLDPKVAHDLIRAVNPEVTATRLDQGRQALNVNAIVEGGDAALFGLGSMSEARWQTFFTAIETTGVVPAGTNWRDAYTDLYLPGRG